MNLPNFFIFPATLATLMLVSTPVLAQKSGQSMQIQYGVVIGSSYVKEKSKAPVGALIGGGIGLLLGKGKSTGTKIATTAVGAGLGGATASAAQGSRDAREYRVATSSGEIVIISDQTEISVDDCVVVENPGTGTANIRRVAATLCQSESAEVVAGLSEEMQEEAHECVAAKQELVAADSDAAIDRALRKISILCDY
jgi:outer membrane lipoprotein SlyB